ncbi:MAG: hypothetical protein WC956_01870 [bacterium]
MNVTTLRENYCFLEPEERARLFLSKAAPKRDDALADALEPASLLDRCLMNRAETIMIFFGAYWLSKLCTLQGARVGFQLAEDAIEDNDQAAWAIVNKCHNIEGGRNAALALALHEFDEEQGGWLKGVAAIMDCCNKWDNALAWGIFLQDLGNDQKFQGHLIQYRQSVHSFWDIYEGHMPANVA